MEFDEFGNPLPPTAPPEEDPIAAIVAADETLNQPAAPPAAPWNPGQWTGSMEGVPGLFTGWDTYTPQPSKVSQGTATGRTVSSRGMTDAGLRRSRGVFAGMDQAVEAKASPYAAEDAELRRGYDAAYDRREAAVEEQGRLAQEHYDRNRQIQDRLEDFYETSAELEKQFTAQSKAEREQYLAGYKEQLAAVRQLIAMNPNPLGGLSTTQAGALGFAQFAQGFLATRGHQIDVSGQIDKWIDRELQQHQQKISNTRQSAQDQLSLYEIARQSSKDEWEARQRYRGFVIEGLKSSLQKNAERFNSQIAMQRAKEEMSKLDIEHLNTESALGNAYFQKVQQIRQSEFQQRHAMGQLAIQQATLGETRRHNMAVEDAADRAAKAKAKEAEAALRKISDPGNVQLDKEGKPISGGKFQWTVDKKDAVAYKKAGEAREFRANMHSDIEKLKVFYKQLDTKFGPQWYKDRSSKAYAMWNQQRFLTVKSIIRHMSGLAATDSEVAGFLDTVKDPRYLEAGERTSGLIDNLGEWSRSHFENTMDTWADKIPVTRDNNGNPVEEYDTIMTSDPRGKAAADARISGGDPETKQVDVAVAETVARSGKRSEATAHTGVTQSYLDFARSGGTKLTTFNDGRMDPDGNPVAQPKQFAAVDQLAQIVLRPDTEGADTPQAQEAVRNRALEALDKIISGKEVHDASGNNRKPSDEVMKYAHLVKEKLYSGQAYEYFADRISGDDVNATYSQQPDKNRYRAPNVRAGDEIKFH